MFRALTPVAASLAALALVAGFGIVQRSAFGTPVEDRFYGFFLDRYPLFGFAVVYGLARIGMAALAPGPRRGWRVPSGALGLVLFLALCMHPTFGGLVLRPGFMTGGMGFLTGQTMLAASFMGAAASASVFGLALWAGTALARLGLRADPARTWWASLARASWSYLAILWGALALGAPRLFGIGELGLWPRLPLEAGGAVAAGGLVLAALLPHALVAGPPGAASRALNPP